LQHATRMTSWLHVGLFVYGYCFYYYLARSDMSGFMQTSFFFGALLSTALAGIYVLALGVTSIVDTAFQQHCIVCTLLPVMV